MSLVNVDDSMPSMRVLPKVFADVPSQEELNEAKRKADAAKAGAGRLMIITVLLAGGLIAVAGFLGYTLSTASGVVQKAREEEVAKTKIVQGKLEAAEASVKTLTDEVTKGKQAMAPVAALADLDAKTELEMASIRGLLAQGPYAKARLGVGTPEEWAAYDKFTWTPFDNSDWHTYVVTNLAKKLDLVTSLKTQLKGWSGGVPGAGPKICPALDPNCK